ncbi:wd repeat-containing protein [Anaeramoeba flamelloides]|uniref:Wd repeat-containing protein n=1 Tax=Anaeramoeba flamelloides TaxID=1746091 RepID=A0AAV8AG68_9EUKA|nr:wd repeat-containing protein [Anaeramoeba flamelloides]
MSLSPKTIVGALSVENKGSIDLEYGLLTYGCSKSIVIFDLNTNLTIQVLDGHRNNVTAVKFSPQTPITPVESRNTIQLVSGDQKGYMVVWNAVYGSAIAVMSCPFSTPRPVKDVFWLQPRSTSPIIKVARHNSQNKNNESLHKNQKDNKIKRKRKKKKSENENNHNNKSNSLNNNNNNNNSSQTIHNNNKNKSINEEEQPRKRKSDNIRGATLLSRSQKRTRYLLTLYEPGFLVFWSVYIGNRSERAKQLWFKDLGIEVTSMAVDPFKAGSMAFCSSANDIWFLDLKNPESTLITTPDPPEFSKLRHYRISENGQSTSNSRNNSSNSKKLKSNTNSQSILQVIFYPHKPNLVFYLFPSQIFLFDSSLLQVVCIAKKTVRSNFYRIIFSKTNENFFYILHHEGSVSAWKFSIEKNSYKIFMMTIFEQYKATRIAKVRSWLKLGIAINSHIKDQLLIVAGNGSIWKWEFNPFKTSTQEYFLELFPIHSNKGKENERQKIMERGEEKENKGEINLIGLYETICERPCCLSVRDIENKNEKSIVAVGSSKGTIQIVDVLKSECLKTYQVYKSHVDIIRWVNKTLIISSSSIETKTKMEYKNQVSFLDLESGRQKMLNRGKDLETGKITDILLSSTKRYVTLIFSKGPFEIWDLNGFNQLARLKVEFIGGFAWSFGLYLGKEFFIFSIPGQQVIYQFIVNGTNLVKQSDVKLKVPINNLSTLDWRSNSLIMATTSGEIHHLDTKKKITQILNLPENKLIKYIRFRPSKRKIILILYQDGHFDVYDLNNNCKVNEHRRLKHINVKDAYFITSNHIILLCDDGCLRIFDIKITTNNSKINFDNLKYKNLSPVIYNHSLSLSLKIILQLNFTIINKEKIEYFNPFLLKKSTINYNNFFNVNKNNKSNKDTKYNKLNFLKRKFLILSKELKFSINNAKSLAERFLLVSKYYYDSNEIKFWELVIQYSNLFKKNIRQNFDVDNNKNVENENNNTIIDKEQKKNRVINIENNKNILNENHNQDQDQNQDQDRGQNQNQKGVTGVERGGDKRERIKNNVSISTNFGILQPKKQLFKQKMKDIQIQNKMKTPNESFSNRLMQEYTFLNQKQKALKICLENGNNDNSCESSEHFYQNLFNTVVLSASISQQNFLDTIKKIVEIIIKQNLSQGVQLLCSIGCYKEACEYLIKNNKWEQALLISKINMKQGDSSKIFNKYANKLWESGQFWKAIHLLTSVGNLQIVEKLIEIERMDIAFMFLLVCFDFDFDSELGIFNLLNQTKNPLIDQFNQLKLLFANLLKKIGLSDLIIDN